MAKEDGVVSIMLNNSFAKQRRRSLLERRNVRPQRKDGNTFEMATLHVVHVGGKFVMLVALATSVDYLWKCQFLWRRVDAEKYSSGYV